MVTIRFLTRYGHNDKIQFVKEIEKIKPNPTPSVKSTQRQDLGVPKAQYRKPINPVKLDAEDRELMEKELGKDASLI